MSATASKNATTTASELDLDAYRKRNETEREWQLRKLFIERFQDQFEHDRLLCLSQCYVNIKTLGCRYSDRIMNQIKSLTVDFDPIVDERIEPIIKEMREKNPPQQNHSKQKQEKQAKNSPKPQQQQQQQQQQNQPKQKLISKTQFVLGSPLKSTPQTNVNSNVAATVTNPVQILARPQQQQQPQSQPQQIIQQSPKQSQPPQQQQQQQPSTPNSKKLGQTAAVATAQSQNLLGKSPAASSGVPVMTGSGEAAPNPALLPIPFGLQSSSSPSMSGGGKPAVRNVLLAQFSSSSSTSSSSPANPFAILTAGVAGGAAAVSVPLPPLVDDQNFRRLARVNKLRDVLRDEQPQLHVDENFDWSAYIEQKCASVGVNIAYNQFEYKAESTNSLYNPDGCALYYGELILESFRVTTNESKKRKKCKSGAFKHAYEILTSKSELAVKQVSAATRRNALLVPSVGKQQSLPIVDFDYELYSLDGSGDASHRRIESVAKNLSTSLPTTTTATTTATTTNVISHQELSNMMSIDQMLKMMILRKENKTAAMDVTVEEKKTPNDADDDDDENRSQGSDKKSKIKQSLPNFILFIPSSALNSEEMTLANFDKFLHERNSINVLQNSCAKCKYAFELETKEKKAKSASSKDNGSNGKNNASVDQAESDEHDSQNNDVSRIKCKCLINGVKIATASAKNKNDAKRLAALKALKYLFKTFPVFKETSYQSIINNPTNNNSTAAANDATATETSKNALMASLGITPQAQPQTTPQYYKISKEDLFGGLIPPTMFEKSSCGAAAVAVASSQQQLAQTNPSAASSSFGTN